MWTRVILSRGTWIVALIEDIDDCCRIASSPWTILVRGKSWKEEDKRCWVTWKRCSALKDLCVWFSLMSRFLRVCLPVIEILDPVSRARKQFDNIFPPASRSRWDSNEWPTFKGNRWIRKNAGQSYRKLVIGNFISKILDLLRICFAVIIFIDIKSSKLVGWFCCGRWSENHFRLFMRKFFFFLYFYSSLARSFSSHSNLMSSTATFLFLEDTAAVDTKQWEESCLLIFLPASSWSWVKRQHVSICAEFIVQCSQHISLRIGQWNWLTSIAHIAASDEMS